MNTLAGKIHKGRNNEKTDFVLVIDREKEDGYIIKEKYERIYQNPRHRKQTNGTEYTTYLGETRGTIDSLMIMMNPFEQGNSTGYNSHSSI